MSHDRTAQTASRPVQGQARGRRQGRHAVVMGAGMGGLFTARALTEHFDHVTVIERDTVPEVPERRRGVPQGSHVHGFQARGVEVVEELFPGIVDDVVAAGASVISNLTELHFSVAGHLLNQRSHEIRSILLASRPFLEHTVRTRLTASEQVTLRPGTEVRSLITRPASSASSSSSDVDVVGVRIGSPRGGEDEELYADLVVDSTGRGSRTPVWLEQLGYERPPEERITVRVKYASQLLRLPADTEIGPFYIEGRTLERNYGTALFHCEHDTWVFTVFGVEGIFTKPTREWMLAQAEGVFPPQVQAALRAAEPISPVSSHGHAASVRRRYDALDRFPTGFLVVGDALCAFNPVYGLGMSVAAEEAVILRRELAAGTEDLAARFLRAADTPITTAWDMSAGSDLAYPETEGSPSRSMRFVSRYLDKVLGVAESDPEVARRFLAVAGLVAPRPTIFHPRVLLPVLASMARRRPAPRPVPAVMHRSAVERSAPVELVEAPEPAR